jgi:hypothetical protein
MAAPENSAGDAARDAPSSIEQLARARAAARAPTPAPPADPAREALAEADKLLSAADRSSRMELRDARELRWLFRLALVAVVCVLPAVWWARWSRTGQTVAVYAATVALVVAGWGAVRAGLAIRNGPLRGVARLWLLLFFVLFGLNAALFVFAGWHADWSVVWRGPAQPRVQTPLGKR